VTLQTIDPAWQISTSGGAANLVTFTPAGDLVSTNVQDAIEEVQGNIGSNDGSTNANTLVTTAGSSSAYTVSAAATITAYAEGQKFLLRANHASTGASTLNVDSLGAKNLQKYDASGSLVALAAGDLPANSIFEATYDGTRFVLVSPAVGNSDLPGVLGLLDEDDMASDSASEAPSQQSVKAYVVAYVGWTYTSEGDLTNGGANDLSEFEFTGLPSGITEIEVLLDEAGESGNDLVIQLSTGTTFVVTGYRAGTGDIGNEGDYTDGFPLNRNTTGNDSGVLRLVKGSGNKWYGAHGVGTFAGGGRIDLGGTLDGVRISTSGALSGVLNNATMQVRYR